MRSSTPRSLLFVFSLLPAIASATVKEPNGLQVPQLPMNGTTPLFQVFQDQGDPVDWQADAYTTPSAFVPLCGFGTTVLLKESPNNLGLGWYNETGQSPAPNDIYPLIPPGSPVGTQVSTADILKDPAFAGGLVGFALLGPQTHYTNQSYDPLCSGCNPPGHWDFSLMFSSQVTPDAYYIAFEDAFADATSWNGDGNFNSEVFFLTGLTCAGGDEVCNTQKPGVCGPGRTVCTANGVVCQQSNQPDVESCNGLDDDCNGLVDDGASCPDDGQVCSYGQCIPSCATAGCPAGKVCADNGTCVESACATVACPNGQVCTAGVCRPLCSGVTCPGSQICQGDRCVDPCAGVTCADGEVCVQGSCRARCDCHPCGGGTACNVATGLCTEPACTSLSCAPGTVCHAGQCVNACQGVNCPPGQMCTSSQCVDIPLAIPDAGTPDASVDAGDVDAGTVVDAGTGGVDAGTGVDAGESDAGTAVDAGTGEVDAGESDAGTIDAGSTDVGVADAGTAIDAGVVDAGTMIDAGAVDAGTQMGSHADAGAADAGQSNSSSGGCGTSGFAGGWISALVLVLSRRRKVSNA